MAKEKFVEVNFKAPSLALIAKCNAIIREYNLQGFRLSLRQLYYQLVARDIVPNTQQSYKRVGSIVSDARDAGLIDWNAIEDRGRSPYLPSAWESPSEILRASAEQFRINKWEDQENYVEVMVEKDALSGILRPVCRRLHVRITANKGYSSSTAVYDAGQRYYDEHWEKSLHLIYLGDHDPSGIDMTKDIQKRMDQYGRSIDIEVTRLALNMDQVETWNPPPNPAKETDSRFAAYRDEYGDESWELDAVEPATLAGLVEDHIRSLIDEEIWDRTALKEKLMQDDLIKFADEWDGRQP